MSRVAALPKQTQMGRALFFVNLLSEPLFTLYGFIPFILYKDLGASTFQIALLTMLKPMVTILSFYWRRKSLRSSVLWAGFWMRAPFLLCPFFDSAWYVMGAAVNYMLFYRAGIPGWMEMVRQNMSEEKRGKVFSLSSGLAYAEGVVLSLAMGGLLDRDPGLWKGFFVGAAVIGLLSLVVQGKIPAEGEGEGGRVSLKEWLVRPWRDSYRLIRERADFSRFQWGFMICGFGIMLIQPALPIFAVDFLGISYLEMAVAISIAKGLGFALSSPVWGKWIARMHVNRFAAFVFLTFAFFPVLLSFSGWSLAWLYIAYFWYGVAQGGSHLVWNLSGPIFAGKEESSRYTGVNVALAGLRGAVAPPLGGFLVASLGPVGTLLMGGILCFYSGARLLRVEGKGVPEKASFLGK